MNAPDEALSRSPNLNVESLSDQVLAKLHDIANTIVADVSAAYMSGLTAQVALLTIENQKLREQNQELLERVHAATERSSTSPQTRKA